MTMLGNIADADSIERGVEYEVHVVQDE